jgi:hypothetical protein
MFKLQKLLSFSLIFSPVETIQTIYRSCEVMLSHPQCQRLCIGSPKSYSMEILRRSIRVTIKPYNIFLSHGNIQDFNMDHFTINLWA